MRPVIIPVVVGGSDWLAKDSDRHILKKCKNNNSSHIPTLIVYVKYMDEVGDIVIEYCLECGQVVRSYLVNKEDNTPKVHGKIKRQISKKDRKTK